MRVTERSIGMNTLNGLQDNMSRLNAIQLQLSSGKQISKPSDSPSGTAAAMGVRADLSRQQQYSRNADDGLAWLGTIDNVLTSSLSQVQQARSLVVQGMSTGSADANSEAAIADQIDAIKQSMLGVANTRYLDRPIFGGTTAGSQAYDSAGNYVGDSGSVDRTVGDGVKVPVGAPGPTVFGTGSTQLFTVFTQISSDLRSNPSALGNDLNQLDTAMKTLQSALSGVGARYNQVQMMQQSAQAKILDLKTQQSNIEDIDLPSTITDLQMQQVAYQAALSATSKVIQPSLVDFLK